MSKKRLRLILVVLVATVIVGGVILVITRGGNDTKSVALNSDAAYNDVSKKTATIAKKCPETLLASGNKPLSTDKYGDTLSMEIVRNANEEYNRFTLKLTDKGKKQICQTMVYVTGKDDQPSVLFNPPFVDGKYSKARQIVVFLK